MNCCHHSGISSPCGFHPGVPYLGPLHCERDKLARATTRTSTGESRSIRELASSGCTLAWGGGGRPGKSRLRWLRHSSVSNMSSAFGHARGSNLSPHPNTPYRNENASGTRSSLEDPEIAPSRITASTGEEESVGCDPHRRVPNN